MLTATTSYCQNKISIDSLSKHIGEKATICDKVYSTKFLEQSNKQPTFLNLGATYPDNPLTIVIFGDDRKNFTQPSEEFYINKNVCVTGELKEFHGKLEIVVKTPDVIKIE